MNRNSIEIIVNKKIDEVKNKFKENNISIRIKKDVINRLINECNYEIYGARKVNKVIDEYIDNNVIDSILMGKKNICINV